jgi:hypothetical protein
MPFSTPFHKQLDPAKQAGQVFPAQAESEAKAAIAAAKPLRTHPGMEMADDGGTGDGNFLSYKNPAHDVAPPSETAQAEFVAYVDVVARFMDLTTGESAGARRQVIERTWFETLEAAERFRTWAAKRHTNVSTVCWPLASQRLLK